MKVVKLCMILVLLLFVAGCGEITNFRIWNDAINIMNGVGNITFIEEVSAYYRTPDDVYDLKLTNTAQINYDPYTQKVTSVIESENKISSDLYYLTSENEELFFYEIKDDVLYKNPIDEEKFRSNDTISVIDFSLNYMPSRMKKISSTIASDKLLNTYTNSFTLEDISTDYLHVFDEILFTLLEEDSIDSTLVKGELITETILINPDKSIHQIRFDISNLFYALLHNEYPYRDFSEVKLEYVISFIDYDETEITDSFDEFILDEAPDHLNDNFLMYEGIEFLEVYTGVLQTKSDIDVYELNIIAVDTNLKFFINGHVNVKLLDEFGNIVREYTDDDNDGKVDLEYCFENEVGYYLAISNLEEPELNLEYSIIVEEVIIEGVEE